MKTTFRLYMEGKSNSIEGWHLMLVDLPLRRLPNETTGLQQSPGARCDGTRYTSLDRDVQMFLLCMQYATIQLLQVLQPILSECME